MPVLEAGSIMLGSHMQQAVSGARNTFQLSKITLRIAVKFLDDWRMKIGYSSRHTWTNFATGVNFEQGKATRAFH